MTGGDGRCVCREVGGSHHGEWKGGRRDDGGREEKGGRGEGRREGVGTRASVGNLQEGPACSQQRSWRVDKMGGTPVGTFYSLLGLNLMTAKETALDIGFSFERTEGGAASCAFPRGWEQASF